MLVRFCIVFISLFVCLRVSSQKISQVEFFSLHQKVTEKYGGFTIQEKVLKHFISLQPTEGENLINDGKSPLLFQYHFTDNDHSSSIRCFTQDTTIHRIKITFLVDSTERFYGAGEQFSHFLLNGHNYPMITQENGIGRGDKPITKFSKLFGASGTDVSTYYPIPYVLSSNYYSLSLTGASIHFLSSFDFTQKGKIIITIEEPFTSIQITRASSFDELFKRNPLSPIARQFDYPDWSYKSILGLQGGAQKVEAILDSCIKIGNPVGAIWIQDWCGRRKTRLGSQLKWEWIPDTSLYPDFKNWVKKINVKGVKVMGYVNPFLAVHTPMFQEAQEKGYLLKNEKGKTLIMPTGGFDAALVNVLDVNAANWLREIIEKNMIGNGLSGWMADFGEWCPLFIKDSIYNSFLSPNQAWQNQYFIHYKARNAYTTKWSEINANAVSNHPNEGLLFFMRSGAALSNLQCPMFWMGDQMVSWGEHDGIKSTVTALNSAAMSGIYHLHSDIGGYTTVKNVFVNQTRSRELFYRWAELNVFQPFFRTHEGVRPSENHQFYTDSASLHFFTQMAKLHAALKDYHRQYEGRDNVFPMIHPLVLDYPEDEHCFDLKYQFMYGKELMVAPVLDEGVTEQKVYLPKGEWLHLYSGKTYTGKQFQTVPASIGETPVFIKSDSKWRAYFEWLFSSLNQN